MTHSSARSFITTDARGVPVSCDGPGTLASFEQALHEFQSYFGDPLATLDAALALDPDFALGHLFRAIALLLSSEAQYLPAVRENLATAELLDMNARERRLATAARYWANGDLDAARLTFDEILVEYPCDVLALQAAHVTDFYCGDARALRDRVARVLPRWSESMPGYSYVLGLFAFGLEECNEYARAEETGRRALEIEPRDAWAIHAVAHVMEMTGRVDDGIEWLRDREQDWAPDNGLAFHNWWHLGLFYLEREDYAGALDLFDECVYPRSSNLSLQLVDASALLWRLMLLGVDVEDRWQRLARDWRAKSGVENGYYAFN
ncbi:MAG: tetratricopeptide repeat protein, partial [Gammaproteobacteria bacterium]